MKKTLLSIFGAAAGIAGVIVATHQRHDPPPPQPPPPVVVATHTMAVIVEASTGGPVVGADVSTTPSVVYAQTNQDGYTAATVPAGHYRVEAHRDGWHGDPVEADIKANMDVHVTLIRDAPPVLPVHSDGPIFRTSDGTPWRYMGVSGFALPARFARGEDVSDFYEAYRGFNVVRAWPYVPVKDWGDKAWDVSDVAVLRAFIADAAGRGWHVELTLLTDDDPARLAWAKAIVPQLTAGGCPPGLLLEASNEPETHKAINTATLRGVLAASGCLYASGDYEDSSRFYGSYLTAHTSRDNEWPRRAHDALEYYSGGGPNSPSDPAHRCPVILDEPPKLQDVGANADDWRAYFGAASLLGAGATFHSETGKFGLPPTADESALAAAALEGLTAFPADAPLGPYVHDTDDEHATGSLRSYRVGPYGVRMRPQHGEPILIGGK